MAEKKVTADEKATYDAETDRILAEAAGAEADKEATLSAIRNFAVSQWAKQFVLMFQLAAEFYPEEIKAAVGVVFDITALQERVQKTFNLAAKAADLAEPNMRTAAELDKLVKKLQTDFDVLARRAARAEEHLKKMAERHARPWAPQ